MNRGWDVEIWGWKICILANSEHVIWRFLKTLLLLENSGCLRELWMLVRILLLATWCLANFEVIWYPRWTHHQASPALYQRSGRMKRHTWIQPEGRDEMRWDEMNRDMWLPCMQHDLVTYPRKCMTWHDKRQAGSWVSRIPYREQVQVHASMNPSTTSSIASLGNIGKWAVAPLLTLWLRVFHTHKKKPWFRTF